MSNVFLFFQQFCKKVQKTLSIFIKSKWCSHFLFINCFFFVYIYPWEKIIFAIVHFLLFIFTPVFQNSSKNSWFLCRILNPANHTVFPSNPILFFIIQFYLCIFVYCVFLSRTYVTVIGLPAVFPPFYIKNRTGRSLSCLRKYKDYCALGMEA